MISHEFHPSSCYTRYCCYKACASLFVSSVAFIDSSLRQNYQLHQSQWLAAAGALLQQHNDIRPHASYFPPTLMSAPVQAASVSPLMRILLVDPIHEHLTQQIAVLPSVRQHTGAKDATDSDCLHLSPRIAFRATTRRRPPRGQEHVLGPGAVRWCPPTSQEPFR